MVKTKRASRNSLVRVSAIRAPPPTRNATSSLSSSAAVAAASTQESSAALVRQLSSSSARDRITAARTISSVLEMSAARNYLLREKLVQTVLERSLTDSDEEVVCEGFGILRSLAAEQGYEVCVFLWRKDVLASVTVYLGKIEKLLAQNIAGPERRLMYSLLENVLALTTSLGGCSDDIRTSIVSRLPDLTNVDMQLISSNTVPESTKVIAAENLYVLSDMNKEYVEKIKSSGFSFSDNCSVPVRVYLAGVQYNILETVGASSNATAAAEIDDIVATLSDCLNAVDVRDCLSVLAPNLVDGVERPPAITDEKYQAAQNNIIGVQIALELITGISESLTAPQKGGKSRSDPMPDADGDDAMEEEGKQEDSDEDMQAVDDAGEAVNTLRRLVPYMVTLLPIAELQSHALHALNNSAWTLTVLCSTENEWRTCALGLWTTMATLLRTLIDDPNSSLDNSTACIGVQWACSKTMSGKVPVQLADVRYLINAFKAKTSDHESPRSTNDPGHDMTSYVQLEFQVRTVGLLGALAQRQGRVDMTREIAVFLITQVASLPNTRSEVVIESLDALFDIFGDKAYDYDYEVFVRGGLLKHLSGCLEKVRRMAKSIDGRTQQVLRMRADDAAINLARFVQYKTEERR
ncbi:uncharacterized protein V1518DRAFT_426993 [Limtongia smithiae]|uniref:uncharacterized protein n=1 Tax=Limtongia smithiae TaxID=1125753 RepID=UPI0034CD139D